MGRKNRLIVDSPAKVNLYLKVLSKRPDGYHNILSIVDPVSIFDRIYIEELEEDKIIVEDDKKVLPAGNANTVFRAAGLLKEKYNIKKGLMINITKNIPIGSGLGGPSSNAATTIKALIDLWDIKINRDELFELSKTIGADCPLFIYGKSCIMKGIGDLISPIELPRIYYLIVYPNTPLSTKDVYGSLKIVLTKKENDIKLRDKFKTIHDVAYILDNDLEKAAIAMLPLIKNLKERLLEAGAVGAMMSGSGSSVFGVFESEKQAERASNSVKDLGSVFIAQSII